jgi:hypothetical protein
MGDPIFLFSETQFQAFETEPTPAIPASIHVLYRRNLQCPFHEMTIFDSPVCLARIEAGRLGARCGQRASRPEVHGRKGRRSGDGHVELT